MRAKNDILSNGQENTNQGSVGLVVYIPQNEKCTQQIDHSAHHHVSSTEEKYSLV